jgi:integrase
LLEKVKGPKRKPYPISWDEQGRLFRELPPHLATMALFAVNTGCRAGEVLALRWDWEVYVPELTTTVFVLPDTQAKNGEERVVVLNQIARSVVEGERGKHPVNVFCYKGRRLTRFRTMPGNEHAIEQTCAACEYTI